MSLSEQPQAGAAHPERWAAVWAPCAPALLPSGQVAARDSASICSRERGSEQCLRDASQEQGSWMPLQPSCLRNRSAQLIWKGYALAPSGHILVGQVDHQERRGAPG